MFARFFLLLFIYLTFFKVHADTCTKAKSVWTGIVESQQATCVDIKNSKECQSLYSDIDKTATSKEEATYKKLKCKKDEGFASASTLPSLVFACAMGAIVDPVVDLGKMLGEGAAQAKQHWSNARDCDKNLNQKTALLHSFNLDVPKLLRIDLPNKEKLNSMSCAQIQVMVLNHHTTQSNRLRKQLDVKLISPTQSKNLTAAEKEYLQYMNNPPKREGEGLQKIVEKIWSDLKIKHQCYSPEQLTKLYCETASFVASIALPGLAAVKAAKLSKSSGIKVEELLKYIGSAERKTAGVGGKFSNSEEKIRVLQMADQLSNTERISAAEKLLGRTLSNDERAQLLKIHDVGKERGFFNYTKDDINKKIQLAMETNPESLKSASKPKPYFDINDQKILMRNGITGIWGEEAARVQSARTLTQGFELLETGKGVDATKKIQEGFSQAGSYYGKYVNLEGDQFKKSISLGSRSTFDEDVSFFFPQAVQNGLPPDKVVEMAKTITATETGISKTQLSSKAPDQLRNNYLENLEALERNLKAEMEALSTQTLKASSQSQKEFKEYLLLEARFKLKEESAQVRFQNKYKEMDLDQFAEKDPAGFDAYQKLSEALAKKRKSLPKEWPYRGE